jgi:signal transduction histidine kinase
MAVADDSPALEAALLELGGDASSEALLERLVHIARDLVGARYAALGVPDDEGGFARFVTAGMSEAQIAALGPLPRAHGLLGAMLGDRTPSRTADIRADPRFQWWPRAHPTMRAFLGVPIVRGGTVVGAFYLTRETAEDFTADDQALVERLAAHSAIAIENALLLERSRELTVGAERNRLARELHDSVSQTLFSLSLAAETAEALIERDPAGARAQLAELRELAAAAQAEMRALVFELRPADLEREGLASTLRKHGEVLRRVHGIEVAVETSGETGLGPQRERELFRIAQEAVANALRHAQATRVDVRLHADDARILLEIEDDGLGFTGRRAASGHLGLATMRERARALGGRLEIDTAPGQGTVVRLRLERR